MPWVMSLMSVCLRFRSRLIVLGVLTLRLLTLMAVDLMRMLLSLLLRAVSGRFLTCMTMFGVCR